MEQTVNKIEELLEKLCCVIDFLPEQVKPSSRGQFFDVKCYLLNSDKQRVEDAINTIMNNHSGWLNILLPDENVLVVFEWDSLNLTAYNQSKEKQALMQKIACSEALL